MSLIDQSCKYHLACISVLSIILNIAMVVHKLTKGKYRDQLLHTGIGMSNILLSTYFTCRAFLSLLKPANELGIEMAHSVAYSFSIGLFCLHLYMNLALAFERYQIALKPMRYSNAQDKIGLQRRILLIAVLASFAVGLLNGVIISITHNIHFFNWTMTISGLLTHVLLSITYVKIFRKVTNLNTFTRDTKSLKEAAESNKCRRKKFQDDYLKKVFTGITISFFVFNFPLMIAAPFHDTVIECGTTKGGLMIAAVTMSALNLIFDPLWYFHLQWCIRLKNDNEIPANKYVGISMQNIEIK